MTTEKKRNDIYTRVFSFLIAHNIQTVPVDVKLLCMHLDVELVPLSEIENGTGLSMWDVFEIWGNEDGTAIVDFSENRKIFKATPHKLQSFRLAEVYQHILWITSAVLPAKAH